MSAKQEETMHLQHQLDQTNVAHDKAAREAQETRGLWEAEVRGCGHCDRGAWEAEVRGCGHCGLWEAEVRVCGHCDVRGCGHCD